MSILAINFLAISAVEIQEKQEVIISHQAIISVFSNYIQ